MKHLNRRDFVRNLVATGTALSLGRFSEAAHAESGPPIAIQLYTVREKSREDFKGTLRRVAEIGYKHFEFAGYGGLEAGELSRFLEELGATACGTHEGFPEFLADPARVIEFNQAIGNPYIVVPSMPRDVRSGGIDGIRGFANDLNKLGGQVKKANMQLCYHNHSFEFEKVEGGQTIWDVLFTTADADLVKAEVDIAWVYNADVDPIEHLDRWGGRVKLLHMKDLDREKKLAPVGTGIIDMKGVVKKAKEIGVDWYVVEQDQNREGKDILDEIAVSYRNLAQLLA